MNNQPSTTCIAAMGSLTLSLKAQQLLRQAGASIEVVSLLREETRQGCAYGISFPCTERNRIRAILAAGHLTPTQYVERRRTP
jgi:hypothetical protein